MRSTSTIARWLCFLALSLLALPAFSFPSYGNYVDRTCTANGWSPARPFNPNQLNTSDPSLVNCGLCHVNAASPNAQLTNAGLQFKRSGYTDVSPFCSPPALNHAPVFTAVAPQQATAGQLFRLAVRASDPDGDALALSVSNAPAGSTFTDHGDGTGDFAWTPGMGQTGGVTVTFHATDAGVPMASATLDVAIAVGAVVNHAPVLAPIGDQHVSPGVQLALQFTATDADGGALAFSMSPLPSGASLTGGAFAWTPSAAQVGNYPVTVSVSDSGTPPASDSEALVITVGSVNRPPVLQPIGDRSATVGEMVRIAIVSSDPDGDAVALACSGLPADASFTDLGDGTGEIVWTPSAPGQASVTCQGTDAGVPAGVAQETFTLTARALAPPPGSDAPALSAARWEDGMLSVRGSVPTPAGARESDDEADDDDGARVDLYAILADGSAVPLGSRAVEDDGAFEATLATFIAPCEVAAAANGAMGAAMPVQDAPASCGRELLLQVRRAELSCDGKRLRVEGRRAPPGGAVLGSDASSGASIFSATLRGTYFGARASVAPPGPSALTIRAQSRGYEWQLPAPVSVKRTRCGRD